MITVSLLVDPALAGTTAEVVDGVVVVSIPQQVPTPPAPPVIAPDPAPPETADTDAAGVSMADLQAAADAAADDTA